VIKSAQGKDKCMYHREIKRITEKNGDGQEPKGRTMDYTRQCLQWQLKETEMEASSSKNEKLDSARAAVERDGRTAPESEIVLTAQGGLGGMNREQVSRNISRNSGQRSDSSSRQQLRAMRDEIQGNIADRERRLRDENIYGNSRETVQKDLETYKDSLKEIDEDLKTNDQREREDWNRKALRSMR
jgi:hypothetical protein